MGKRGSAADVPGAVLIGDAALGKAVDGARTPRPLAIADRVAIGRTVAAVDVAWFVPLWFGGVSRIAIDAVASFTVMVVALSAALMATCLAKTRFSVPAAGRYR